MNDLEQRNGEVPAERKAGNRLSGGELTGILLAVVLVIAAVLVYLHGMQAAAATLADGYAAEKELAEEDAYNAFYDSAYDQAEAAHHVENRATITLGKIRELQQLEVLPVSEVVYEITDDQDGLESWIEIPGRGVYTVNLETAEFIVDQELAHVMVLMPRPELTNCAIDFEDVVILKLDEHGFRKPTRKGVERGMEELKKGERELHRSIHNNQELYQMAEESGIRILETMIRQVNPGIPDLKIDVEYYA